ncbi:RES family NAD+ phosphorylase [Litorivivens sp.]|uniref:RES family NAD+ phosphorylase n=1 Tax=Litorivivens sp. TaxID=2020868 RepID=UPI003561E9BE
MAELLLHHVTILAEYNQNILEWTRNYIRCKNGQLQVGRQGVRRKSSKFNTSDLYKPSDYSRSRMLGRAVFDKGGEGIYFNSVRHAGSKCFALFYPDLISDVIQASHYAYKWDGKRLQLF